MKLTRILTKKLLSFWLFSLFGFGAIVILGASLSFFHLTYTFQANQVNALEQSILTYHDDDHFSDPKDWLTPILKTLKADKFELRDNGKVVFQYQARTPQKGDVIYQKIIHDGDKVEIDIVLPKPYSINLLDWQEFLILLLSFILVFLLIFYGYRWIKNQLDGIESLSFRSHLILSGNLDEAMTNAGNGQPRLINRALTKLLRDLNDASKERARFDNFIRSNTFLDPQTRVGNHLFFKNRLDALSYNKKMIAPGVIYLLKLEELDSLTQHKGEAAVSELLQLIIDAINKVLTLQPNSIFARKAHSQFAIIVPQISLQEADNLAKRLLKICMGYPCVGVDEPDNFYHIGCAYFQEGDNVQQLQDEVYMALKASQLQGASNWFMYDKGAVDEEFAKGSVRWRSILENAIANDRVIAFGQRIKDIDGHIHHQEIFSRIKDAEGNIIQATLFMPMAVKCGLMPKIEQKIIEYIVGKLLVKRSRHQYSINLSKDSLQNTVFTDWLINYLVNYQDHTQRLIFEINEENMIRYAKTFAHVLQNIKKLGVRLCVDHVGQEVVSTQYLTEFQIDLIKLHRSITHQLHLRPENQLFIRSLMGGLYRTKVQVMAEGVELLEEWQTLQILGVSAAQGSLFGELRSI